MTGLLKKTYEDSEDYGDFYSRLKPLLQSMIMNSF